jgi:hypothetical protein
MGYQRDLRFSNGVPKNTTMRQVVSWHLRGWEKLVRERGAGSRDFISNFFGILTTMAR